MLDFLVKWLDGVPRTEVEAQQSQAASLIRDLSRMQEIQANEITRLRGQVSPGLSWLRVYQPQTIRERVWRCLILYGFTTEAQAAIWKNCVITDVVQFLGQGSSYTRPCIRLLPGNDQDGRVIHECAHAAFDWLGIKDTLGGFRAQFKRLVDGEGSPEAIRVARQQWYNEIQDGFSLDEHLWVYPMTNGQDDRGLMGRTLELPPYLQPYFAPVFTGQPLATS